VKILKSVEVRTDDGISHGRALIYIYLTPWNRVSSDTPNPGQITPTSQKKLGQNFRNPEIIRLMGVSEQPKWGVTCHAAVGRFGTPRGLHGGLLHHRRDCLSSQLSDL
jgi:hypothetical protein